MKPIFLIYASAVYPDAKATPVARAVVYKVDYYQRSSMPEIYNAANSFEGLLIKLKMK